jgi:hypothetical protein
VPCHCCMLQLNVGYPFGPGLELNTSAPPYYGSFSSFKVFEVLHDSGERKDGCSAYHVLTVPAVGAEYLPACSHHAATDDYDRQSMSRKKMLRAAAPQVQTDMAPAISTCGSSQCILLSCLRRRRAAPRSASSYHASDDYVRLLAVHPILRGCHCTAGIPHAPHSGTHTQHASATRLGHMGYYHLAHGMPP